MCSLRTMPQLSLWPRGTGRPFPLPMCWSCLLDQSGLREIKCFRLFYRHLLLLRVLPFSPKTCVSNLSPFSFLEKDFFRHSLQSSSANVDIPRFCFPDKIFVSPSLSKDDFTAQRILGGGHPTLVSLAQFGIKVCCCHFYLCSSCSFQGFLCFWCLAVLL